MAPILRGEIRHVILEPANVRGHEQGSDRPALILSNDRFNATSKLVIVALIGSS
jgi:mRNA-degrading endonuclease toxin of MazEF toxin-antitoxin module